jgi:large subunit ribosomal protein L3
MTLKLIGKKIGMMQVFDEKGNVVVCSVVSLKPNYITQIKSKEKDGYNAVQIGAIKKNKNVSKPLMKHFEKAKVDPCSVLLESRVDDVEQYQIGQEQKVDYFTENEFIDVQSISKGKGYQGVMKLHGYSGGPAAHGSGFHRHAGSTGMRSTPGRCLPGGKRASRMGGDKKTVQNLQVFKVLKDKDLMLIKGSISGSCGSTVYIRKAKKKTKAA